MPFNFNPALWFVCKLCREPFSDTDQFKAHKLECHLGESLHIKCIVFEEKLLDHEWNPSSQEFDSTHNFQVNLFAKQKNQERIKFKNPYVSLKSLTAQELNPAFAANSQLQADDGSFSEVEDRTSLLKQPKAGTDVDDEEQNKFRESLNSAVIIKTEADDSDESNDQDYLEEPQEIPLPVSILPTPHYQWPATTTVFVSSPQNIMNVEFVDDDFVMQNQNAETISTINEHPKRKNYHAKSDLRLRRLPTESAASNNPGTGAGAGVSQPNKKQKSFVCPICSASFSAKRRLTRHAHTHSPKTANIGCPQCELKFKSKAVLRVHLVVRHGRVSSFRCRHCEKYFTTRADLISHEAGYTGARPFKCDFPNCRAQLKSRTTLYAHTRLVHGKELGIPQFECPTCGKSFALGKALNLHTRKAHTNTTELLEILS